MTEEQKRDRFVKKAMNVHCNENLDYSKVVYVNNRTHIIIIDNDLKEDGTPYGEFKILPCNFLKGQGHPLKRGRKISESKRAKEEEIIERFKEVHKGENLDYSEVKYVNMHTKVKIISHDLRPDGTEYGEFWQEPVVHLKGCTHPDIGKFKSANSNRYNTETFIQKANIAQEGKPYSYENVNYVNSKTKVEVICHHKDAKGKEHGPFLVSPDLFLQGKGCPKCGNHLSYAEDEIYSHIVSLFGEENVVKNDKTILDGKEIDVFIPSKKIGFEFDGLRWHSEQFKSDHNYQLKKKEMAYKKGVFLFPIFEDEYLFKKYVVFDKIDSLLNTCKPLYKAYGRKIIVKEIAKKQAQTFLEKFHIQGYASATIYLGGFLNEKLVAVMSFVIEKDDVWNLNRYCTDFAYSCPGVAGKILSTFINMKHPKEIKSFLDYRWCKDRKNNMYTKLGFQEKEILSPDYHYTNGHGQRLHKFRFRKQKLSKKYGFPMTMTETEMTRELGYDRIWDCGLIKYVWTSKK